jgi:hypothetical protein
MTGPDPSSSEIFPVTTVPNPPSNNPPGPPSKNPPRNNPPGPPSGTHPATSRSAPASASRSQHGPLALILILALALLTIATSALAAGTPLASSFTYQGVLKHNGSPASGQFDFQFTLFDGPSGSAVSGAITRLDVTVEAGQFAADLDFGASVFTGDERYLRVSVRPAEPSEGGEGGAGGGRGGSGGSGGAEGGGPPPGPPYTDLYPLQRISPAPYAIRSLNPGPQGPPGAQGIVNTGFLSGAISPIAGNNYTWVFAGPWATVTLQPGQRIVCFASAAMGMGVSGQQNFEVDVGWQASSGGIISNSSGSAYMIGVATSTRTIYPVNGVLNPGPGTWRIGVVVRNGGPAALNVNDYINLTYMIVNQ